MSDLPTLVSIPMAHSAARYWGWRLGTAQGTTDRALSLRLALKYLDVAAADEAEDGNLKIGNREVAVLGNSFGGYRSLSSRDNLRGFEVMLNYRNTPQIAPVISLEQLSSDIDLASRIANKVVLVGYVGAGNVDTWHSLGNRHQLPGVMVHAQMTSNILSYILDDRALITTESELAEFAWILLWGTVGGATWLWCGGSKFWLVQIGAIVIVIASCELYLVTRSVWMPRVDFHWD